MGDTAGFFTSKARFIPLGIAFGGCRKRVGFIRFEKGEIFWKKTLFLVLRAVKHPSYGWEGLGRKIRKGRLRIDSA